MSCDESKNEEILTLKRDMLHLYDLVNYLILEINKLKEQRRLDQ